MKLFFGRCLYCRKRYILATSHLFFWCDWRLDRPT